MDSTIIASSGYVQEIIHFGPNAEQQLFLAGETWLEPDFRLQAHGMSCSSHSWLTPKALVVAKYRGFLKPGLTFGGFPMVFPIFWLHDFGPHTSTTLW